nr:LOG family protein [Bradyrhizobium sp. LMTR 3]
MLFICTIGEPASWKRLTVARRSPRYQRRPVDRAADARRREPLRDACAVVPLPRSPSCQTRKSKQVPSVLFGSDHWKRLVDFDVLIEEGVISPQDLPLFQYADTAEAAWQVIREFYRH